MYATLQDTQSVSVLLSLEKSFMYLTLLTPLLLCLLDKEVSSSKQWQFFFG